MKNIFNKIALAAAVAGMGLTSVSCSSDLDLTPSDWYTADNFWTEKSQYEGNIIALQNMFRGFTTNILFNAGEVRAGTLYLGTLADGSGSASEDIIRNQLTPYSAQFNNLGGYWGFIANLNELIYRIENQSEGILDENTATGLKAVAYGWRAFCYFQMYRMYGGVPIRLEPDVVLGNYDAASLYKARATAEETLAQIKSDIQQSLNFFANSTYRPQSSTTAYVWNEGATQLLAGQVYLWSGKVSTGDHNANPSDVATAKTYFNNVLTKYGYALQDNFFNAWLTPLNKEEIFGVCYYSLADATFYGTQTNFNWSYTTGGARGALWSNWGPNGYNKVTTGEVSRFGMWATVGADGTVTQTPTEYDNKLRLGVQRYQYKNALYYQFNENDTRRDAFFPVWNLTTAERETNVRYIADFDETAHSLAGTFVLKFRYSAVDGYDYWQCRVDMPIYRLPDAILGMAECCNYEGDNNGVATYMNMLRKRAYGSKWDEALYGYTPGTFKENEVAILHESDKEFFLEGRRWFDLRRLTTVKGGSQTDHLIFQPEGCVGYGLDVLNNPWMTENSGEICATTEPVLPKEWEYRLLWPLNSDLLGADPLLEQNPGY
ncbi:MAG: RagB/SusD family nutrient uptake outer membrane protein [Bacteroides sp.]|nr:RagB/SusD family nutrient uptake outer membrane protein [Bacteroides sp.]